MPKTKYLFKIVFPKKEFKINFLESENGDIDINILKNRIISETQVIKFYKKHLLSIYNIVPGDMNSLKYFMENYNSAMIGIQDKYHQELTNTLKLKLKHQDSLY